MFDIKEKQSAKFLKIAIDKNLDMRAEIEEMVGAGVIREIGNQHIYGEETIGENITDTIIYFKNKKNSGQVNAMRAQQRIDVTVEEMHIAVNRACRRLHRSRLTCSYLRIDQELNFAVRRFISQRYNPQVINISGGSNGLRGLDDLRHHVEDYAGHIRLYE